MAYGFTTAAYVVAAVLFIQSLGGLSGQESAKRAVWYGIVGMALAVAATIYGPGAGLWYLSLAMIVVGGAIGWFVAQKVQMTEMPQLVAAMHSLVGLAAVFIGFSTHAELARVMALDENGKGVLTGFAALLAHNPRSKSASCGLKPSLASLSARSPLPVPSSPLANSRAKSMARPRNCPAAIC